MRDVARRDRTRRKNLFSQNRRVKTQKSKDRKKRTQKAKIGTCQEILSLGKRIAEAKTLQSFQFALKPARSPIDPVTEMPRSYGSLDVPQYISPLMRPRYMKRLSPSLLDGPSFFLRRSVVGSISNNRGRNYEPARLRSFCGQQKVARRTPPYRGCMSVHGCACATSTPPYLKGGA